MTHTEEEILNQAGKLHQKCHRYWETLSDEVRKGTTFHSADAHIDEAKRLLRNTALAPCHCGATGAHPETAACTPLGDQSRAQS